MLIKEKSYSQRKFHGAKYYQLYYRIILPSFDRLILVHLPPSHQKKNSIKGKENYKIFWGTFQNFSVTAFFRCTKKFRTLRKTKEKMIVRNRSNLTVTIVGKFLSSEECFSNEDRLLTTREIWENYNCGQNLI